MCTKISVPKFEIINSTQSFKSSKTEWPVHCNYPPDAFGAVSYKSTQLLQRNDTLNVQRTQLAERTPRIKKVLLEKQLKRNLDIVNHLLSQVLTYSCEYKK